MSKKVKSGKEILDEFFNDLKEIQGVDSTVANALYDLYNEDKFSDANVKNKLQELRDKDASKD
ncbi:MAG: hypothetical protein IPM32_09035 [Ignavibacteriae bacterium]|nr:hypothetical protein [Ignavibacteriota bacterium]